MSVCTVPFALFLAVLLAACAEPARPPAPENPPPPPGVPAEAPSEAPSEISGEAPSGSVWEAARAAGIDFRGVGNEPGWLLEIRDAEALVLVANYGQQRHVFPAPDAGPATTSYDLQADGHRLRVTLEAGPCADTMSDETYPTTVTVHLDDRTFHGCGRSLR